MHGYCRRNELAQVFNFLKKIYFLGTGIFCWALNFALEWASWKYKFYTYHGYIEFENVMYTLLFSFGACACLIGFVLAFLSLRKNAKEKGKSAVIDMLGCFFNFSFLIFSTWQICLNSEIYFFLLRGIFRFNLLPYFFIFCFLLFAYFLFKWNPLTRNSSLVKRAVVFLIVLFLSVFGFLKVFLFLVASKT